MKVLPRLVSQGIKEHDRSRKISVFKQADIFTF